MLLGYGVAPRTIQSLLPSDEGGGGVPPTACCKEPFSSAFHGEACGVLRYLIVSETVMAQGACSTACGALCVRARRARGRLASMSAMLRSLQMRDPNDRRTSCRGGLPEDARGLCGRRPAPGSAGDCHVAGSIDQLKFSRAGMPTSPSARATNIQVKRPEVLLPVATQNAKRSFFSTKVGAYASRRQKKRKRTRVKHGEGDIDSLLRSYGRIATPSSIFKNHMPILMHVTR